MAPLSSDVSRPLALIGGCIILPSEIALEQAVLIEQGVITGIVDAADVLERFTRLDVEGRYISPGLIDIHIHGARGFAFNQPTRDAWTTITRENALRGVTTLLATLATDSLDQLEACLRFGRGWVSASHADGAQILGIHLEGPFFT
ncbi:MAG: amidohydrolase family protein, partial [Anaerolineae bacterium]|nr:amidohydrolase family protein [Anaerolineae bacterium]